MIHGLGFFRDYVSPRIYVIPCCCFSNNILTQSKLPKMMISRMEEFQDMEEKWTVESIRMASKRYSCAQEVGQCQTQVILGH